MATSGLFTIITNDGRQDQFLMATSYLNRRIEFLSRDRAERGKDPIPTLSEIEQSHILFLTSHYKPFAAIGYEYNITKPIDSKPEFGKQVTFSIPELGDFFSDMCVHVVLGELQVADPDPYKPDPPGPPANLLLPDVTDKVRYADRLGNRLLREISFSINGNELDRYNSYIANSYQEFYVSRDKRVGYNRCIGQEVPLVGYLYNNPGSQNIKELRSFTNGPQTFKTRHEPVEMFIPLLFWFNKDFRLAIPSVACPYGSRFINVTIERLEYLVQTKTFAPGREGNYIVPEILAFELFINHMFVDPTVHDIMIRRIGFTLIRTYRFQEQPLENLEDQVLLSTMKWPIETMYVGFMPYANKASVSNWYKYYYVDNISVQATVAYPTVPPVPPPPTWTLGFEPIIIENPVNVVDTLGVSVHEIPLYREYPVLFYNAYTTFRYGMLRTPDDPGLYMINFNLYPGIYQPSGYINISRARELYLNYTSNPDRPIGTNNPSYMHVIAIAINFLLISDGQLVVRFST